MSVVRIEPEAEAELGAGARWYEKQRAGLGGEFIDAADEAVSRIAAFPDVSTPVPGVEVPARRVFIKRFPYSVVFIRIADELVVLAFMHARRRPGYWLARVPES